MGSKALALSETPPDDHQIVRFNADQIALIKSQVCKPTNRDATDDELALFLHQAQRTGLDPLSKQVYAIFRWDGKTQREKMTVQTGIDGFRLIAQRTGQYAGRPAPVFMDANTSWTEVWLKQTPPAAAKATVRKLMPGGIIVDTEAIATWAEYYPGEGAKGAMWRSRPSGQLAKCAEALALRAAFPNDLSGLYTTEEMAQADAREERREPTPPTQPRAVQHGPAENPSTVTKPATADTPPENVVEGTATEVPATKALQWPPEQPHPDLAEDLQSLRNEAIAAVQSMQKPLAFMAKQIDRADKAALAGGKDPDRGYHALIKAAQQHEAQSKPASRA